MTALRYAGFLRETGSGCLSRGPLPRGGQRCRLRQTKYDTHRTLCPVLEGSVCDKWVRISGTALIEGFGPLRFSAIFLSLSPSSPPTSDVTALIFSAPDAIGNSDPCLRSFRRAVLIEC